MYLPPCTISVDFDFVRQGLWLMPNLDTINQICSSFFVQVFVQVFWATTTTRYLFKFLLNFTTNSWTSSSQSSGVALFSLGLKCWQVTLPGKARSEKPGYFHPSVKPLPSWFHHYLTSTPSLIVWWCFCHDLSLSITICHYLSFPATICDYR